MTKSARTNPTNSIPTLRRVEPTSSPAWIKPQRATLVEKAPDGPDWLHEIKEWEPGGKPSAASASFSNCKRSVVNCAPGS
jgi:hypothetical protein